jgi:hypothetical protein
MGTGYNPRIVTDGLVFALDAGNPRCYVGTGLTAFDLKGSVSSSLVNGTGFSSSQGGYFSFDGTNDYIDCGNFLDNPSDFTVMAWQKTSASTNIQMIVAKLVNYGSGAGWALFTRGDIPTQGLSFILQTNVSNWIVYYCNKLTNDNNWHHVAAIISNKIVTGFYVDGVSYSILSGSGGTISSISNAVNVRIGRDEANEYIFQGNISQAQLYNRVLLATEIRQNYNATKGRYGL